MITRSDVGSLLLALRSAGLRIGVHETLTTEFLLGRLAERPAPLASALRALLVKSDQERESFDRVFADWSSALLEREQTAPKESAQPRVFPTRSVSHPTLSSPRSEPRRRPTRKPTSRRWLVGLVVLLLLFGIELAGLGYWLFMPRPFVPTPQAEEVEKQQPVPVLPPPPPPVKVKKPVTRWVPTVTVLPRELPRTLWYGIGWLVLWGGLFGAMKWMAKKRRPHSVTVRANLAPQPGAVRLFLDIHRPAQGFPARFLDRTTEEALVWGIDKYVSEEPTRRVDVRRSVAASARSALLPVLHFQRARHQREVWLWLDESTQLLDPASWSVLSRLADEIERALRRSGLPVERALFYGIPHELTLLDGNGRPVGQVTPSDLEDRRSQALIAVLTTGDELRKHLDSNDQRQAATALLRVLSHFPQLVFVEGVAGSGLQELLRQYELAVISSSELATYLGGERSRKSRSGGRPSDALAWAAACALPTEPITEETAFWLREALKLPVQPEAMTLLRAWSGSRSGPLRFPLSERARLWTEQLGPLHRVQGSLEQLPTRLQPTLLGRTLALFRQRITEETEQRTKQEAEVSFAGTEGAEHLLLQRALLDLWDRPEAAVLDLEKLAAGPFRDEIRQRLGDYVPAEREGIHSKLVLPWRLSAIGEAAQKLLALGLGGASLAGAALTQKVAGRQHLGFGGVVGAVLASMVLLGLEVRALMSPHGKPQVQQQSAPKDAKVDVIPQSATEYLVTASSGSVKITAQVPAAANVLVTWEEEESVPPDGGSEDRQDLGVDLAAPPDLTEPVDLAQREYLRMPKKGERPDRAKPPRQPTELRLPEVVSSTGPSTDAKPSGLEPKAEWSCTYQEWMEPKSGVVFVKVCGGTFQMGSEPTDKEADDDEKPSYPVKMSDYWIGKYEVSNEQYRKYHADHKGQYEGNELPVESVTWNEARAFCRLIGGDLPTEAEWEYAARGPTGRKYPWGNQPAHDHEYAVFNLDWDKGPEAITSVPKGRGPFGTLNQAGNVWEWVTDCYNGGAYEKRKAQSERTTPVLPVGNPVDDRPGCDRRVLRGGSFASGLRDLRSANQLGNEPEFRSKVRGFRCVRGSQRQR